MSRNGEISGKNKRCFAFGGRIRTDGTSEKLGERPRTRGAELTDPSANHRAAHNRQWGPIHTALNTFYYLNTPV